MDGESAYMSSSTPSQSTSNPPARHQLDMLVQQLDELEVLMERMLALPEAPGGDVDLTPESFPLLPPLEEPEWINGMPEKPTDDSEPAEKLGPPPLPGPPASPNIEAGTGFEERLNGTSANLEAPLENHTPHIASSRDKETLQDEALPPVETETARFQLGAGTPAMRLDTGLIASLAERETDQPGPVPFPMPLSASELDNGSTTGAADWLAGTSGVTPGQPAFLAPAPAEAPAAPARPVGDAAYWKARTRKIRKRRRNFRWFLAPLVWWNRIFDRGVELLGWPGEWLHGSRGRAFLGILGILCLVLALSWWLLVRIGWTW